MKLRIKNNSIRLRLTKTEVDLFGKEGYLDEEIEVAGHVFTYTLQQYDGRQLSAELSNNRLVVNMPVPFAKDWVETNKVGYEYEKEQVNGKKLYLLIEKDFKCLDENIHEDQSDNYDNPLIQG